MSTMQNYYLKKGIFLLMLSLLPLMGLADPGDGGGTTDDDPDEAAPIDGGISLLAVAEIGYGAKKMYDMKKQNKL